MGCVVPREASPLQSLPSSYHSCELPAATPENGLSPRRQASGAGAREWLAVLGATRIAVLESHAVVVGNADVVAGQATTKASVLPARVRDAIAASGAVGAKVWWGLRGKAAQVRCLVSWVNVERVVATQRQLCIAKRLQACACGRHSLGCAAVLQHRARAGAGNASQPSG